MPSTSRLLALLHGLVPPSIGVVGRLMQLRRGLAWLLRGLVGQPLAWVGRVLWFLIVAISTLLTIAWVAVRHRKQVT